MVNLPYTSLQLNMRGRMGKKKIYEVKLSQEEKNHLENLVSSGEAKARKITRARILLKANEGWFDHQICSALDVGSATVERIRKKYSELGLDAALNRKKSTRIYEQKIDGRTEAHLIKLVCSDPPAGYARWSLKLISERLVQLEEVDLDSVAPETVRQALKKTNLSLGEINSG